MEQDSETSASKDDCPSQKESSPEISETAVEKSIPETTVEKSIPETTVEKSIPETTVEKSITDAAAGACDNVDKESSGSVISDAIDKTIDDDSTAQTTLDQSDNPQTSSHEDETAESTSIPEENKGATDAAPSVSNPNIDDSNLPPEKSVIPIESEPCVSTAVIEAAVTCESISKNPDDQTTTEKPADNETETLITTEETQRSVQSVPDSENSEDSSIPIVRKTAEITEMDITISETDVRNKDATDKQIIEPENTEFVQITQDKTDDPQNEGQTMEAEDPFGADDPIPDNVETVESDATDQPAVDVDFRKLGDQADNLQDVVNAKDCDFTESGESPVEETARDDNAENIEIATTVITVDGESTDSTNVVPTETTIATETNDKNNDKIVTSPMIVDDAELTSDESKKKSETVVVTMDNDDEQSDVLQGQDDELCIIPDSMKESGNSVNDEKNSETDVTTDKDKRVGPADEEIVATNDKDVVVDDTDESTKIDDSKSTGKKINDDDKNPETTKIHTSTTTDVIEIDDECKNLDIEEMPIKEICKHCNELKNCNINVKSGNESYNVCSQICKIGFTEKNNKSMDIPNDGVNSKREKRCASCLLIVESGDERNLSWETMEFCNEECLGKFQTKYGSYCRNCNGSVQPISLGKYCVRFGYDVRQFCCSSCLEEFKKGLKVCSYCQKDISSGTEGFLAPVGDKAQFKDFCTQYCMEKYSRMNSMEPVSAEKKACSVCQEEKMVHCEVQIDRGSPVAICSDPCFAAFKFVNKVDPEQCSTCKKFFELTTKKSFVVFYESEARTFCNKTCLNIFIITNRNIVPCNWCKVKKYNFDMIRKELKTGQTLMMCSLNCLTLYQVSINAVSAKRISCDFCKEYSQAQYHLTMSDATIRNFCSYNCVMKFQGQYTKSPITIPSSDDPVPTGMPKRTYPPAKGTNQVAPKPPETQNKKTMPVISSVTSLALTSNGQAQTVAQTTTINSPNVVASVSTGQSQSPQVIVNQQVIVRPVSPPKIHNKVTQCKPLMHTKGVSVRPHPCAKSTQTESDPRVFVPIPVPIYVPFPVHMWNMPYPVPVPFPLPIPVPIFIPTTRNSAKGIFKDIKRIQEKIPADPFEAELLMMAEMVATEKKANDSESDSSDDNGPETAGEPVDSSNTFGEDMLQMALKMATGELDEPAVDLETALTPTTITATHPPSQNSTLDGDGQPERLMTAGRGKKRMVPYKPRSTPSKRGRRVSGVHDGPIMPPPGSHPSSQTRMIEPLEKPDANMALKYTFGVNAWRQWVVAKNTELEKQITPTRKVKLFKTDLLQLTADELNYTLCLFVKEVRKPNGAEYAPDTIYYLCLGIQQYLFENNRIDNIFTDSYYEKFTDCLNDVAKKFSVLYNEAQYIVTRVEEEHLWECKQLGAHSPHVLLSTLMFFNTKHFNLVTVEEHMQLSFSHIMKHWKRNPAAQAAAVAGKGPGTRNVLLRFYPPQSALEANSRKKKVYEQQENEDNPLRCPVKLYEFYLSKCPESVKTRNDVFYLLPERSCVPDSPVWYSTSALAKDHLVKMLYRVKMVKEINVALLTS